MSTFDDLLGVAALVATLGWMGALATQPVLWAETTATPAVIAADAERAAPNDDRCSARSSPAEAAGQRG